MYVLFNAIPYGPLNTPDKIPGIPVDVNVPNEHVFKPYTVSLVLVLNMSVP
jgi:hypothetical protein